MEVRVTWTRWAPCALFVATAVAAASSLSCTTASEQTPATTTASAEDKLARGRRITYTSGCMDCHTPGTFYNAPDTTRLLSGSELGWTGPWGTTYPRNLTPDSTTGIGSWTEEQIVIAVREGRRPDGSPILPPMPWPVYSHMTDEDAYALAAYLKSIPPVVHQVPAVDKPGAKPSRPSFVLPAPPEWDARNMPAPGSAPAAGAGATGS
jgi:mono/diheme cytochrome c family protein